MPYAIDLNQRQSARTLEQAIRHRATAILEPRIWPEHEQIAATLEPACARLDDETLGATLALTLSSASAGTEPANESPAEEPSVAIPFEKLSELVGTYCDVVLPLGEQRYMFSTDVIKVVPPAKAGEPARLRISRPATLQVAQRRRFRRIKLSHSAQVELTWTRHGEARMGGVGWLCNISGDGMACRTEERVADMLWIGEQVEMEFTLAPGDTERFKVHGVLCNKTPSGSLGKIILGIQFIFDATKGADSARSVTLLRRRLMERHTQLADSQKGADA